MVLSTDVKYEEIEKIRKKVEQIIEEEKQSSSEQLVVECQCAKDQEKEEEGQ